MKVSFSVNELIMLYNLNETFLKQASANFHTFTSSSHSNMWIIKFDKLSCTMCFDAAQIRYGIQVLYNLRKSCLKLCHMS